MKIRRWKSPEVKNPEIKNNPAILNINGGFTCQALRMK